MSRPFLRYGVRANVENSFSSRWTCPSCIQHLRRPYSSPAQKPSRPLRKGNSVDRQKLVKRQPSATIPRNAKLPVIQNKIAQWISKEPLRLYTAPSQRGFITAVFVGAVACSGVGIYFWDFGVNGVPENTSPWVKGSFCATGAVALLFAGLALTAPRNLIKAIDILQAEKRQYIRVEVQSYPLPFLRPRSELLRPRILSLQERLEPLVLNFQHQKGVRVHENASFMTKVSDRVSRFVMAPVRNAGMIVAGYGMVSLLRDRRALGIIDVRGSFCNDGEVLDKLLPKP